MNTRPSKLCLSSALLLVLAGCSGGSGTDINDQPGGGVAGSSAGGKGGSGGSAAGGSAAGGSGGSAGGLDGGVEIDGGGCKAKTCAELGANCGAVSDGCGALLDCGSCPAGEGCGVVKANVCGAGCKAKTCAELGATCGKQGDGCGKLIDCGACEAPQTCGGGGVPNTCGAPGGACVPKTCAQLGANCGPLSDGCGGIIDCGACKVPGDVCGAVAPNTCGGALQCTPKTCAEQGYDCGFAGDGCGGIIDCGSCGKPGDVCGGGGANVCGGAPGACVPKTCAGLGANCGAVSDGCGGIVDCGSCKVGEFCGGVAPNTCTPQPSCVPKTCAELGATCGAVADGCGGIIPSCGSCSAPQACSGDPAKPYQCGCTGVCAQVPLCSGGKTTTLTGVVKDPAGNTPLDRVLVYIPNNPADPALKGFPDQLTCDQCGAGAAGNPLVTTYSASDGTFTLSGVPVGQDITLVIQVGRWRRLFKVNINKPCEANQASGTGTGNTAIQNGVLTMPKNKAQGDIPRMAVVTTLGDSLECTLYRMGIDLAEFTNPGGGGRIEMYTNPARGPGDVAIGGAYLNFSTPDSDILVDKLPSYDMVVLGCPATPNLSGDPLLANYGKLVDYANSGGRIFTTHYSYVYLKQGGVANPFSGTATWSGLNGKFSPASVSVETDPANNPKGPEFGDWISNIVPLTSASPPTFSIFEAHNDVSSVVAPTQQWLTFKPNGQSSAVPLHFTFNTPVGAASADQCGRVVFSDFHVADNKVLSPYFPEECSADGFSDTPKPITPQEQVLEYMLFDLGSCVQPYTPGCAPTTCAAQGVECGQATDGCGNVLDCGSCAAPQTCGSITPGKCGSLSCTPTTCAAQGVECGSIGDDCGKVLDCGSCPAGQTCGGAGQVGKCGAATCTPKTCAEQGLSCGKSGDGCGAVIDCGSCPAGQTCGGGGQVGKCGAVTCTPTTCAAQGVECGSIGDDCGKVLDCGSCPAGQTCGGAGQVGKCGTPSACVPRGCDGRCGQQGDGCGQIISCPACGTGGCVPKTCAAQGVECGPIGDGCGGVVECGSCQGSDTCGGGGTPYKCGSIKLRRRGRPAAPGERAPRWRSGPVRLHWARCSTLCTTRGPPSTSTWMA